MRCNLAAEEMEIAHLFLTFLAWLLVFIFFFIYTQPFSPVATPDSLHHFLLFHLPHIDHGELVGMSLYDWPKVTLLVSMAEWGDWSLGVPDHSLIQYTTLAQQCQCVCPFRKYS